MDTQPIWTISKSRYQYLAGVHQPHIGEISGTQYARMSNRARTRYMAQNAAAWDASAAIKCAYDRAVVAAHDAGQFDTSDPNVHRDAKDAVLWASIERKKAEREARLEEARRQNIIDDFSTLKPGDRVWSIMGSHYVRVTKVNTKSIRAAYEYPEGHYLHGMTTKLDGGLYRLSFRDLEASVTA